MFLQLQHHQTKANLIYYHFFNSPGVDVCHMQGQMQSTELFNTTFYLLLLSLFINISFELTTVTQFKGDQIIICLSPLPAVHIFGGLRCHRHSGNRTWALYWTHLQYLIWPTWAGFHVISTVLFRVWLHWTWTPPHLSDCHPTCVPSRTIKQSN